MFGSLFHHFTLAAITEKILGFDRHSLLPVDCKPMHIPNRLSDVENTVMNYASDNEGWLNTTTKTRT